jgi:S-formylglutathione hydrolase FrmB
VKLLRYPRTLVLILTLLAPSLIQAQSFNLDALNHCLAGQLVDHTHNHGADRRIWSPTLEQHRDLYVYLPPGFDPAQRYPLMFWLHGIAADERQFAEHGVPRIDALMVQGKLPPFIIAIPDGTRFGRGGALSTHSGFVASRLGDFDTYLERDVWDFVVTNYPIRPEREAHVMAGVSLGGGAAYYHSIKYRERWGDVLALFPPLNIRWVDCHGRYFGNFDPNCWGWRTSVFWGHEPIGRFYGIVKIPLRRLVYPLYGRGHAAVEQLSHNNPIEMLDYYNVQPGQLQMFVAYGGKDEFNMDAQIESFLYRAREKGLCVSVAYEPNGRHNTATAQSFLPAVVEWLAPRLAPYSPPVVHRGEGVVTWSSGER